MRHPNIAAAAFSLVTMLVCSTPASAMTKADCKRLGGVWDVQPWGAQPICIIKMTPVLPSGSVTRLEWKLPVSWKTCLDSGKVIVRRGQGLMCAVIAGNIDTRGETAPSRSLSRDTRGSDTDHVGPGRRGHDRLERGQDGHRRQ
jgi:hypothetical protein